MAHSALHFCVLLQLHHKLVPYYLDDGDDIKKKKCEPNIDFSYKM
jgi:hypothetical protein